MRLAMAPSNSQVMYALNGSKLFKTTNGGTSWIKRQQLAWREGQCTYNDDLESMRPIKTRFLSRKHSSRRINQWWHNFDLPDIKLGHWSEGSPRHPRVNGQNNSESFWVGTDGGIWRSMTVARTMST